MTPQPVFFMPNEQERDANGIRWSKHRDPRPYIWVPEKKKEVLYSRCTSWIDVLDDQSALAAWKQRITLLGAVAKPEILDRIKAADPQDRETINSIAKDAFAAGDGFARAQKGTDLHELSEVADLFEDGLPGWATAEDVADMRAYRDVMRLHDIEVLSSEQRVVIDDLQVTGTFDRFIRHKGKKRIFDLKTGRVDYGSAKIAMQLAMYSRGLLYDGHNRERTPLEDVDQEVGVVCHLLQGQGRAVIYEVDLTRGWEGVQLAKQVRAWRKETANGALFDRQTVGIEDLFSVPGMG